MLAQELQEQAGEKENKVLFTLFCVVAGDPKFVE